MELPAVRTAFEQFIREIRLIYDLHPQWTGKGPARNLKDVICCLEKFLVGCTPLSPPYDIFMVSGCPEGT